jgi:plastocyanin
MHITNIVTVLGIISALVSGILPIIVYSAEAQKGGTIDVSIVSGASTLTDIAFQPNPVNVKVRDTVRWTNNDNTIHTVIQGSPSTGGDVPEGFLSDIIGLGVTFEHTFNQTGTFE